MADAPRPNRDAFWNVFLKAWAALTGAVWLVGPFVAAGTLRWAGIWIYIGTIASGTAVQRAYVARRNPQVLLRRRGAGAGTKGWDIAWMFVAGPLAVLPPIVAGLGVRAGASAMPWPFALLGFAVNTASGVVWAYAMASNAHFEPTVRIQRDVGHVVVDAGPYRFVRHPAGFCPHEVEPW